MISTMGLLDSLLAVLVGNGLINSSTLPQPSSSGLSFDSTISKYVQPPLHIYVKIEVYILTELTLFLNNSGAPFLLQLSDNYYARRHVQRRQASSFVVAEGTVPACHVATPFTLVGDQLFAGGSLVSADPSLAASQPLFGAANAAASSSSSSSQTAVSHGFSVDTAGHLQWTSSNFSLGRASFCISNTNTIYAVFVAGGAPGDCTTVDLQCVAGKVTSVV